MGDIHIDVAVDRVTRDKLVILAKLAQEGDKPNFASYCGQLLAEAAQRQAGK